MNDVMFTCKALFPTCNFKSGTILSYQLVFRDSIADFQDLVAIGQNLPLWPRKSICVQKVWHWNMEGSWKGWPNNYAIPTPQSAFV